MHYWTEQRMVRRTLEVFECDKCGKDGKRYTILFEDGALILDRCEAHGKKLEALREETGSWRDNRAGKAVFHKSTPEELQRALNNGNRAPVQR